MKRSSTSLSGKLSVGALLRAYPWRVAVTWGLTLLETAFLALLPLFIGRSIDGLLKDNAAPFLTLLSGLGLLLIVGVARRAYDTRAYGTMRVAMGEAVAKQAKQQPVSTQTARLDMSRELVNFLEEEAPIVLTASVQILASIAILWAFHAALAGMAAAAALISIIIYGLFSVRFFNLNRDLNQQIEQQVKTLDGRSHNDVRTHLLSLRRFEVHLSDTEAFVYGLIFLLLLSMLSANLWFSATQLDATPGQIFSIVTYSYEFIQAAVILPAALQSLTRISEITSRINQSE
ncbi:MAG: ABC transporter six-transmembrane domain-containing protein [Pseudomonadota bacterium]